MQDSRYMLISTKTDTIRSVFHSGFAWAIPIAIVVTTSLVAVVYFKKRAPYFAEDV